MFAIGYATIKVSALNIRKGSGLNDQVLTSATKGEHVDIIGKARNGWYKVNHNGFVGYMSNKSEYSAFTAIKEEKVLLSVVTIVNQLNIRTGDGLKYTDIGNIPRNQILKVVARTSNGWYKVVFGNSYGYVSASYKYVKEVSEVKDKVVKKEVRNHLNGAYYLVKKGDTLYGIANTFKTTVVDLKRANGLKTDNLNSGQRLLIPTLVKEDEHIVKLGDSLWAIATKHNVTIKSIKDLNKMKSEIIFVGQLIKIPTVKVKAVEKVVPTPQTVITAPKWTVKLLTNQSAFSSLKIKPEYVVIHWTANYGVGADNDAHYRYFNGAYRGANAHIFVDENGILQILPLNAYGWHSGKKSMNLKSVGIEVCVNADGDFKKTYINSVHATAKTLKMLNLPISRLIRHYDVTTKHCPVYFVEDAAAKKFFGMTAKNAYAKFRKDVEIMMNVV